MPNFCEKLKDNPFDPVALKDHMSVSSEQTSDLRFTFIIPPGEGDAEACMQSIVRQQYPHVEVISSEKPNYMAPSLKVKVIGTTAPVHYLNLALEQSVGEVIGFLSKGAELAPYSLYKISNQLQKGTMLCAIGKTKTARGELHRTYFDVNDITDSIARAYMAVGECFFRRETLDWVGYIDERLPLWGLQEWWVRLLCVTEGKAIAKLTDVVLETKEPDAASEHQQEQIERDTFFHTLASMFRYYEAAYFIREFGRVAPDFSLPHYRDLAPDFVVKILKNFCAQLAREAMVRGVRRSYVKKRLAAL
ncbi:glycosyltransferase family protein [Thermonema rossianum]